MSLLMQALKPSEPAARADFDVPTLMMVEMRGPLDDAGDKADVYELAFEAEAAPAPQASPDPVPVQEAIPSPPADVTPRPPLQLEPDTASQDQHGQAASTPAQEARGTLLRNRRAMLIASIGAVSLALAAALGYVYLQIQAEDGSPLMTMERPMTASAGTPAPASEAASGASVENVSVTLPAADAPRAASTAVPGAEPANTVAPPPAAAAPVQLARTSVDRPAEDIDRPAPRERRKVSTHSEAPRAGIDIVVGAGAVLDPSLGSAYRAYQAGDWSTARSHYQQALRRDGANRDALLGLAAIAVREQQAGPARAYYIQLLELDPSDPDAIGGLSSLQQADPAQHESHLKKVLARHPNAGAVLFSLGNLYALEQRWADAQQAYFRAYGNAPANPDYAMNLAVSLDRLGQVRLALEYYRRALMLAETAPANFNAAAVRERIGVLDPAAAPH